MNDKDKAFYEASLFNIVDPYSYDPTTTGQKMQAFYQQFVAMTSGLVQPGVTIPMIINDDNFTAQLEFAISFLESEPTILDLFGYSVTNDILPYVTMVAGYASQLYEPGSEAQIAIDTFFSNIVVVLGTKGDSLTIWESLDLVGINVTQVRFFSLNLLTTIRDTPTTTFLQNSATEMFDPYTTFVNLGSVTVPSIKNIYDACVGVIPRAIVGQYLYMAGNMSLPNLKFTNVLIAYGYNATLVQKGFSIVLDVFDKNDYSLGRALEVSGVPSTTISTLSKVTTEASSGSISIDTISNALDGSINTTPAPAPTPTGFSTKTIGLIVGGVAVVGGAGYFFTRSDDDEDIDQKSEAFLNV